MVVKAINATGARICWTIDNEGQVSVHYPIADANVEVKYWGTCWVRIFDCNITTFVEEWDSKIALN